MSEAPLELACAQCGKPATRQMSGGAGLVFKGSGFYLTDYGRAGQKPPAAEGASTGGEAKTGDAKPGKSEPAPAAAAPKPEKSSSAKTAKPGE